MYIDRVAQVPFGFKPPRIEVIQYTDGFAGRILRSVFLDSMPETKGDEPWWMFESENPENTVRDGRAFESLRGYRIYANPVFPRMTLDEYAEIMHVFNRYNHRVNQGIAIRFYLHADDTVAFKVKFRRPPQDKQTGIYIGKSLELIGTELMREIPDRLKVIPGTPL